MKVGLHASLRSLVGGASVEVDLPEGATVRDLIQELALRWPPLRERLLDEGGGISRQVNVYVDGRSVRWFPEGDATVLGATASVDLFPPVAGG